MVSLSKLKRITLDRNRIRNILIRGNSSLRKLSARENMLAKMPDLKDTHRIINIDLHGNFIAS